MRDRLRPLLFPASGRRVALVQWLSSSTAAPRASGRISFAPDPAAAPPSPVPQTVSVVIPTLDAGPLLHRVLASVLEQRALGGLEIVVADSGSVDATVAYARQAGAVVVDVPAGEFGHGRSRNRAAEAASGEILLMLVQDAVLLGSDTVRTLVAELTAEDGVVAVSARQVPRSGGDLFGAFSIYAHEWTLASASAGALAGPRTPAARRAAATVDNVCAAIRRDAWQELPFADLPFAEDLEFGLRAVGRGWSVRRSRAAAVAHSHDRDAAYHFRRSVHDRLQVAALIGDNRFARAAAHEPATLRGAASRLLAQVQGATAGLAREAPLAEQLAAIRAGLARRAAPAPPQGELAALEALIGGTETAAATDVALRPLRDDLLTLLTWPTLAGFARAHPAVTADDAWEFAAKLTALALGRSLGDALRRRGETAAALSLGGV